MSTFAPSMYGGRRVRRVRRKATRGAGFFDDLWSGIKNVGAAALPVLAPIVGQLIKSRIGLGRRRVRRVRTTRKIGGIYSDFVGTGRRRTTRKRHSVSRYGGALSVKHMMGSMMGARRVHRRKRRVGAKRAPVGMSGIARLIKGMGLKKRRTTHRRVRRGGAMLSGF